MNKFINWHGLDFKKSKGKEKLRCPECDDLRSDKSDKSLLINHNDGYGKCFYCEALTFKETNTDKQRKYTLPEQVIKSGLSEKLIEWCKSRGISESTLQRFNISEEKAYIPKHNKELNCIVFNYFEGSTLVNKKYRSSKKDFTQIKGGKPIFYNINSIIGSEEVYIVEGEIDVLSMYEKGIKNVISLPNGANDNDDYWINSETYLKNVNKFIIAVDNDEKGIIVRDKIAHRLGRYRCTYIEWIGKDANDDLLSGNLETALSKEKRFPVGGTFTSIDLSDKLNQLYEDGIPKTIYPTSICFKGFEKYFSLINGQLTVATGIPSHGKSAFVEWYVLNLVNDHNMKASFFSPEHTPMELHMSRFAQKCIGAPYFGNVGNVERMSKEDLSRFIEWSKEKIYLTSPETSETPTWDWLLEKFKEQMFCFGVNIFVIDAFNKVEMPKGYQGKEGIDKILTRVTNFAQSNNVSIILVAHPTKMQNDDTGKVKIPTLYDVSGSADFRNQTHNGFTIYRNFANENIEDSTDFVVLKLKWDFQGEIGKKIKFHYHIPTGRYYIDGVSPYPFDMTKKETAFEQILKEDIEPEFDLF